MDDDDFQVLINYDLRDIVERLYSEGFAKEIYFYDGMTKRVSFSVTDLNSPVPGISNPYELLVVTESDNKDEMVQFYDLACAHIRSVKIHTGHPEELLQLENKGYSSTIKVCERAPKFLLSSGAIFPIIEL